MQIGKSIMILRSLCALSNGMISNQIFRDASDPNRVIVVLKWISLENAQKFAQSPELKASMEKAGVVGAPTITFFNEA